MGAAPVAWTPASMAAPPKIWLDDESSVTDAGAGSCSQWSDRSGNDYNFTQATSGARPLIVSAGLAGKRTIRFDGTSDSLENNSSGARSIMQNVSNGWLLMVYKKLAVDGSASFRTGFAISRGTTAAVRFAANVSTGSVANARALGARRLDGDGSASLIGSTQDTSFHVALWVMDWSQGDGFIYVDGALDVSNLALTSSGSTSNTTSNAPVRLGAEGATGAAFADIETAAVLVGAAGLPTTDEIDKLFGWAAWRYGLEANLPGGHPYASAPP